jgi:transmembrane protein 231
MRGDSTEGGLWTRNKSYREQPKLQYVREIIVLVQAVETKINSTINGSQMQNQKEIFFSTIRVLNELHPMSFRMASVRSREFDKNEDGIVDLVDIEINLPLKSGENVYSIHVIPFFDFILSNHVKMRMDTLAYVHFTSGMPITSFTSKGELILKQKALIPVRQSQYNFYADSRLLDISSFGRRHESIIQYLIEESDSRLFSTNYIQEYPTTKTSSTPQALNISLIFHNPVQNIEYTPAVYELFTDAWIRYISLYWIAMKFVHQLYSLVYPNRIIPTYEKMDRIHTDWVKKYN